MKPIRSQQFQRLMRDQRGMTLFEVLIALLLFSVIVTITGNIFGQGMLLQSRSAAAQRVQENATFVLEALAKEIRYATLQGAADTDCVTTFTNFLTIDHPVNGTVSYSLADGTVSRTVNGQTAAMSGADVRFNRFAFCIMGSGLDQQQARIAIIAQVRDISV